MKRIRNLAFIVLTSILLFGCATPASHFAMIASRSDITEKRSEKLANSIYVRSVNGGKSTNPMWTSQVDNDTFKSALNESLAIVGYKSSDSSKAKYLVDVELKKLDQPLLGIDFDVASEVNYTVESNLEKNVIPISANGKATFSESFFGVERLKLANEKSIKANITKFIDLLSKKFP
jgi:hypothetical protein